MKSHTPYYIAIILAGLTIYMIWQFAKAKEIETKPLPRATGLRYEVDVFRTKPLLTATNLPYTVDAARTKPADTLREGYSLICGGVFMLLAYLSIWYLCVQWAIAEYEGSRTILDINLFAIGGSLFVALLFLAAAVWVIYMFVVEGIPNLVQARHWMGGTTKARATIVDRREEEAIFPEDYRYGGSTMTYALILQVVDQPEVPELNGRFILADVCRRLFNKYARKDSVVIYYATDSPLTFILQGE